MSRHACAAAAIEPNYREFIADAAPQRHQGHHAPRILAMTSVSADIDSPPMVFANRAISAAGRAWLPWACYNTRIA